MQNVEKTFYKGHLLKKVDSCTYLDQLTTINSKKDTEIKIIISGKHLVEQIQYLNMNAPVIKKEKKTMSA